MSIDVHNVRYSITIVLVWILGEKCTQNACENQIFPATHTL